MRVYRCRGTITVFLSLVSVLFISLVCTLVESARLQGCRAWAAAVTDMGLFSVFAEYEPEILEKYDVLLLDGSYGTGDFEPERLALQMREFMKYNAEPTTDLQTASGMNLFPMDTEGCAVTGYMLATDEEGSAFYQQVVESRWENLAAELVLKYQQQDSSAQEQQEAADEYEEKDAIDWDELERLEEQQAQSQESEEDGTESETDTTTEIENPLGTIKKIKEMGILGLVVSDISTISDKSVTLTDLPSGRQRNSGNIQVEQTHTGVVADGIFQDYLLEHFGSWESPEKDGALEYQIEYMIAGKSSDEDNLKAVVNRLLLLREGANFLYIVTDAKMRTQALTLATSIVGVAPIPGLKEALAAVLMLAWAYGESLLDVRTLLSGGRVPATKDATTWKLSLSNLAKVTELLAECDDGGGTGQNYEDYLRVLMLTGEKASYPLRALDMMESGFDSENARADAWVIKAEAKVSWRFPSVFMRVTEVFMNVSGQETGYEVSGSFGY